jgi:3-oxoacyl-[acyl-carrier protein] reductase
MINLKDKTVVISGGSKGIGRACCLKFAQSRATVVFTYHKSTEKAKELESQLKQINPKSCSVQADVTDFSQCKKVISQALEINGKLDILLNNAGIKKDRSLMMMTPDDWHAVVNTNLNGTFNMTRAAIITLLKQKSGKIINMSSTSGIIGLAGQSNYSASKAGIIGFTKALAKEVAAYNITVNALCPGYIETDMVNSMPENMRKKAVNSIPAKRIATPEEVAEICLLIASTQTNYLTGDVIKLDGGLAS